MQIKVRRKNIYTDKKNKNENNESNLTKVKLEEKK